MANSQTEKHHLNITKKDPRLPPAPQPVELKGPRCPYCFAQPAMLRTSQVEIGTMLAAIFCCGNCESILSIAPVAFKNPQQQPSIIIPGRG